MFINFGFLWNLKPKKLVNIVFYLNKNLLPTTNIPKVYPIGYNT